MRPTVGGWRKTQATMSSKFEAGSDECMGMTMSTGGRAGRGDAKSGDLAMPLSDIRQGTFNEPDAGCVAAAAQHNEMWVRVRRYASPRINTPQPLARPVRG